MSQDPMSQDDERQEPAQALSKLEEALRQALEITAPERVLAAVHAMFPALPAEIDAGAGFHGRVKKVSVSMPEELTAAVRARTGPGGFSRYVTEAVDERLRLEMLEELLAEHEAKFGPIPEEFIEKAMREWPDFNEH